MQSLNMQPDDTAPENESAPPEAKAPSPLRSAGALQRSDKEESHASRL